MAQLQSTNITGSLNVTDTTFLGGNLRMANGTIIGVLGGETLRLGKISGGGSVDIALGGSITVEQGFTINNTTGLEFGATAGANQISANTAGNFLFTKNGSGLATYEFSDQVDKILFGNQGNIGINTSTPSAKLHIVGANNLSDNYALKVQNSSSVDILTVENDGDVKVRRSLFIDNDGGGADGFINIREDGGPTMTIRGAGRLEFYTGATSAGLTFADQGDGKRKSIYFGQNTGGVVSIGYGNNANGEGGFYVQQQNSAQSNGNALWISSYQGYNLISSRGYGLAGTGRDIVFTIKGYNDFNNNPDPEVEIVRLTNKNATSPHSVGIGTPTPLAKLHVSGGDVRIDGSLNISSSLTASGLTYPDTDGLDRQVIKTDGNGNLTFGYTESTTIAVKNVSGGEIPKGTPCYITASGTQGNTAGIIPADAGNLNLMPAGLIAGETLAAEAEGVGLVNGFIQGVDTSTFTSGDTVYIAVGGGYTNVKPTGSGVFIQKLGNVEKVASNGSGVINGPGYYNDLPNWETGKVMVGTDTYPATSSVIHLDEANGRVGIGTTSPNASLTIYDTEKAEIFLDTPKTNDEAARITFRQNSPNWPSTIGTHVSNGGVNYGFQIKSGNVLNIVTDRSGHTFFGSTFTLPTARVHIKGANDLTANSSLLVENSSGTDLLNVENNGKIYFKGGYIDPNFCEISLPLGVNSGTNLKVARSIFNVYLGGNIEFSLNGGLPSSGVNISLGRAHLGSYAATVYGNNSTDTNTYYGTYIPQSSGYFASNSHKMISWKYDGDGHAGTRVMYTSASANYTGLLVDRYGNVGINTISPSERLHVSGNLKIDGIVTGSLTVEGSGSTVFEVNGSEGQLFSITDSLSGSLFAVSDVSGLPILEVFSDDRVVAGAFNNEALVISGSHTTLKNTVVSGSVVVDGSQRSNYSTMSFVYSGSNLTQVTSSFTSTQQITNLNYTGSLVESVEITGSDGVNKLYSITYDGNGNVSQITVS